jgi:hypothetical protein
MLHKTRRKHCTVIVHSCPPLRSFNPTSLTAPISSALLLHHMPNKAPQILLRPVKKHNPRTHISLLTHRPLPRDYSQVIVLRQRRHIKVASVAGLYCWPAQSIRTVLSTRSLASGAPNRRNQRPMSSNPPIPPAGDPTQNVTAYKSLSPIEAAKRRAAYRAVEDHFDTSYKYIGIGSGSTVVYVVEAIVAKGRDITSQMAFIPTGDQSKQLIIEAGLPLGSIDSLPPVEAIPSEMGRENALHVATGQQDLGLKGKRQSLDVAFDGADEIDEDLNCIKGGGACLFQEKLVATSAKKFVCVAGKVALTT